MASLRHDITITPMPDGRMHVECSAKDLNRKTESKDKAREWAWGHVSDLHRRNHEALTKNPIDLSDQTW